MNFLLPPLTKGMVGVGLKIYDSCKDCYRFTIEELGMTDWLWVCSLPTVAFLGRVLMEVPREPHSKKYYSDANVNDIILIFLIAQPELFSYKLG